MVDPEAIAVEFCELVRIDSLSGREGRVVGVVEAKLRALGLEPVRDGAGVAIAGETGNLIARLPATASGLPTVMANAHVVQPGEGIEPIRTGDTMRSAGDTILGADDKAGVVVILAALRQLLADPFPHGEVQVAFTIAEETGLWGARYLDYSLVSPDYVFVFDGGQDVGELTVGAPSAKKMTWTVHGVAAHAGVHPERGVNAIQLASQAIAAMQMGRLDEETTANIGRMEGGRARNIVPDRCEVWGEARSHDEAKLAAQVEHMSACFRQAVTAHSGASVTEEVEASYQRFRLSAEDEVVQVAMQAAISLGATPRLTVGGGGSDANVFNERGLPAVICACGGHDAHGTGETASVPAMARAAEWLVEMVRVSGQRQSSSQG
jgi:tripeptide aminopeptidase